MRQLAKSTKLGSNTDRPAGYISSLPHVDLHHKQLADPDPTLSLPTSASNRPLAHLNRVWGSSALHGRFDMAHNGTRVMKLQVAAVLCVVLLVASAVMPATAAGCDIFQLVPCITATKNAKVTPSKQCCANVAKMGQGAAGAKCLCSLLGTSLAKSQGVVPRIALGIPQKCGIAVPKGFVCQGIRVPGS